MEYSWWCLSLVLPKKQFNLVLEEKDHISFYKDNESIVTIPKRSNFSQLFLEVILTQTKIEFEEFQFLLKKCKLAIPE